MKNLKLALTATTICAGLALGVSGVNAQTADEAPSPKPEVAYTPAINMTDALATVKTAVAGQVQAIFLEETELGHVYIAEVAGDLSESTLFVSADTGEVVAKVQLEAINQEFFDLIAWDENEMFEDEIFFEFEEADFEGGGFEGMIMMLEEMGYSVEDVTE